jgi:uncharacterized protein involved in exopolysaccharide biosynthesis/Mrp family chromosome partitioning ATPase
MYKVHVRRTLIFAVLGLLVGLAVVIFSRKIYEARLEMLLGSSIETRSPSVIFDDEVKKIIDRNAPQGVQTERQLLNSETVFFEALGSVDQDLLDDWEKYYLMYDVVTARTPNQNEQGAGVAQVRVRAYDPEVARKVADAIAVSYNETRRKAAGDAVASAISYLNAQIVSTEEELGKAEAEYQAYKEDKGVAMLDRRMIGDEDQSTALRAEMEKVRTDLQGLDEAVATIRSLIAKTPPTVPEQTSTVRHPTIDVIERQISELEAQLSALRATYTDANPRVKTVNDALTSAKARLVAAKADPTVMGYSSERKNPILTDLESQLSNAQSKRSDLVGRLAALQESMDRQDLRLAESPEMEVQLTQLQRDRIIFDEKYRRLKSQLEELQNRRETGTLYGVVLGTQGATASDDPVAPEPVKLSFIGFIAGACIGLVFSFALEALRPRVYTSGQLADLTGLPVVASIQALPGLSRSRAVESVAKPGGRVMESFRNMAYTYLASGAGHGQTVLFTGIGSAGSSSLGAAQFAVALAQAGTKVVLIDAERTRQVVTNGFGATDKKGVSNALRDGDDPASYLVETAHENLRLMPIGTVPESLVSHAGPDRVESLIAGLRQAAQIVVVSVAPTDIVADAAAFASRVDEVCLCVSAKSNEYGSVPTAYDILDKAGAKSIKLILADTAKEGEPFTAVTSIQRAV